VLNDEFPGGIDDFDAEGVDADRHPLADEAVRDGIEGAVHREIPVLLDLADLSTVRRERGLGERDEKRRICPVNPMWLAA
jgi:hypothetical protein